MTKFSVIYDVMITIDNSGCSMRRKQCYYHPSIGLRQNAADDDDDDEEDNEMVLA